MYRFIMSSGLTMLCHAKATFATDPKYSPWPPISSSKPNIDDDQDTKYPDLQKTANGYFKLPNFKQEIATGVYSLVPGSIVLEWMSDFSKKHQAYKFSRYSYEESVKYFKEQCDQMKFKVLDPFQTFF